MTYWIIVGLFWNVAGFCLLAWYCHGIEWEMRRLANVFVDLNHLLAPPPFPREAQEAVAPETASQQLRLVRAELARVVQRLDRLDPPWEPPWTDAADPDAP